MSSLAVSKSEITPRATLISNDTNDELDSFAGTQWVTITSSRLGRSPDFHAVIAKSVVDAVLRCRDSDAWILVAAGSAIDPWVTRACELFSVPIMRLAVMSMKCPNRRQSEPAGLRVSLESVSGMNGDELVIATADVVEACYVRKRGRIEACLENRILRRVDAATRVCVTRKPDCAARKLIEMGAVGRYSRFGNQSPPKPTVVERRCVPSSRSTPSEFANRVLDRDWMTTRGEWLIHCTRGFSGPWPGETSPQYLDSILLTDSISASRGPLASLGRIVRMRCLVASAVATSRRQPVVCFSELPLSVLLRRRCYRSHLHRWDYEPYGVAVRIVAAKSVGARPVQYGEPSQRPDEGDPAEFDFHPIGKTNDWSAECEWRIPGSVKLSDFATHDVRIFAKDGDEARQRLRKSPWRVDFLD